MIPVDNEEQTNELPDTGKPSLDNDLVWMIFKHAYLAGRSDGLSGTFIDCSYVFESFIENQELQ